MEHKIFYVVWNLYGSTVPVVLGENFDEHQRNYECERRSAQTGDEWYLFKVCGRSKRLDAPIIFERIIDHSEN